MPISSALVEIAAQTGVALRLRRGGILRIVDACGEQVADLALFCESGPNDSFSPGRTMDYNESVRLPLGAVLYSQSSVAMARVVEDTVGVHDLLLAPCSAAMFARRGQSPHPSCHENLSAALEPFGIQRDLVVATLNVFMDVRVDAGGAISIHPPASPPGASFALEAIEDMIVGISACSSELTNNGRCKPIYYHASS